MHLRSNASFKRGSNVDRRPPPTAGKSSRSSGSEKKSHHERTITEVPETNIEVTNGSKSNLIYHYREIRLEGKT